MRSLRLKAAGAELRWMRPSSHIGVASLIAVLAIAFLQGTAQNSSDAHVQPRTRPEEKPLPNSDPALKTHTKPFVSNVDVVLVPVTVTDPMTRIVTGLERINFRVFE